MNDLETMAANLKHAARNGGASIGGGEFTPEECRRVARMLDAAPDLLEALIAMRDEFRALDLPYGSKAYCQATSAINKATGDSK